MTKLTECQRVILSAAAARDDGALLPLPPSLTFTKGATTRVLRGVVRKGLAAEITASPDDTVWRLGEGGERLTLTITDQGLVALGIKAEPLMGGTNRSDDATSGKNAPLGGLDRNRDREQSKANAASPEDIPKSSTKISVVIDLLRRDEGATVADLMAATGWQAHSVRGAISGTVRKKLGYSVMSQAIEVRGRVYRIGDEEANQ